jgi:hypothetical protein
MSVNEIEAIKNMIVMGKPARDFDIEACTSVEQMQDWEIEFWVQFELHFADNHEAQLLKDVFGEDFDAQFLAKRGALLKAKHLKDAVVVNGVAYDAIMKFPVMHCGWESDAEGSLVNTDEGRKLVLSNHGQNYFAKAEELEAILTGYLDVVDQTELALKLLAE